MIDGKKADDYRMTPWYPNGEPVRKLEIPKHPENPDAEYPKVVRRHDGVQQTVRNAQEEAGVEATNNHVSQKQIEEEVSREREFRKRMELLYPLAPAPVQAGQGEQLAAPAPPIQEQGQAAPSDQPKQE